MAVVKQSVSVVFFLAFVFLSNAQDLTGTWLTTNGESHVKIYMSGNGLYYGK